MQLNGSQIFVEVLCEQGVDTIFGYPGGAVLNLYDELYKNADRITHVLTAHEQGAAHAADGYARATGRTGVVLAMRSPPARALEFLQRGPGKVVDLARTALEKFKRTGGR